MHWLYLLPPLLTIASAAPLEPQIIGSHELLDEYDFVVVGAGTAGPVLANRLTEDHDVTVLVIEAGELDKGEDYVTIPVRAGAARATKYDWNYTTVPMEFMNGRSIAVPAGKVVGGGSVLNGMAFDRGAASDYDAWVELGNEGWGWEDLLPYFKKVETFTPPKQELVDRFNITWDLSVHGASGPIHAAFPNWLPNIIGYFFRGLNALGIPTERDGASGRALNAYWATNSINPRNMSRSYSRTGYFDPALVRGNFHVLYNTQATRLVGEGSPVSFSAVEYASTKGEEMRTVKVAKEVIVSAGVIGSPKLLQLSGIGPRSLLEKLEIPVLVDLPTGENYQDHAMATYQNRMGYFPPDEGTENPEAQYYENRTGPWTVSGPNTVGFIPLPSLVSSSRLSFLLDSLSRQPAARYLRPDTPESVVAGFAAQKSILISHLNSSLTAATELIFRRASGDIIISPQHPFSRGYMQIPSPDPWVPPIIDLRYGANPLDLDFYSDAVRFVRGLMATGPMQELKPTETTPGAGARTDEQIQAWAKSAASTMYHSCCTNPMMKRELGGVADSRAKVYGTSNLRVVDASLFPLIPGAHLAATTYAVAEKVADLIKEEHVTKQRI